MYYSYAIIPITSPSFWKYNIDKYLIFKYNINSVCYIDSLHVYM